ncbi:hypothetical protein B0J14DRAFT_269242 [Halenospora varia]|nr:hypothetical protein B0J14DRAFT_269242 [Halenospora varia]
MSKSCYYPDGSLVGADNLHPVMIPCDPKAETSACCHKADICYANGLCGSDYWWPYRGACTDKTWKSKACPSYCASAASGGLLDSFQIITSCEEPHIMPRKFACADTLAGCAKGNFSMSTSKVLVVNLTAADASSSISTTTASFLSQSSSSSAPSTTSLGMSFTTTAASVATACTSSTGASVEKTKNNGITPAVLGISIVVPLLIALVLAIFLFFEHKKRVGLEKLQSERALVGMGPPAPSTAYSTSQTEPKPFEYTHMSPNQGVSPETPNYGYAPKLYPGPPMELAGPGPGELQGEGEHLRAK